MIERRSLAAACALALLAGCGGRGTVAVTPAAQNDRPASRTNAAQSRGFSGAHRQRAKLLVRIRIPRKHRRADFISPSTKGMTLAFTGPTTLSQTVGLTPSSPGCSTASGVTTCTLSVQLLSGSYTGTIVTYDQPPSGGTIPSGANELSTAKNVPFTVVPSIVNNLSFTLSGLAASLSVSGLPSGTYGTAYSTPQSFTVTAKDADGNTIVGPYDNAVTLSTSDATNAIVASSGSDNPPAGKLVSSSDSATLTTMPVLVKVANPLADTTMSKVPMPTLGNR